MAFGATYDACVLYPAGLRDLLIRLAQTGLFQARWTDRIVDEMIRSIPDDRPDLKPDQLERTRQLMCEAVPDCLTTGYEDLKDFPPSALEPYNIEAQTPDVLLLHLIDLAPSTVRATIQSQAAALKNPPTSVGEVLDHLARSGLPRSVAALRFE